jgi:hypothetical protein
LLLFTFLDRDIRKYQMTRVLHSEDTGARLITMD